MPKSIDKMSRNTRSNKRSLTQETVKTGSKRAKTGKFTIQSGTHSNERGLSRSPKVNKRSFVSSKVKSDRKVIVKDNNPCQNNNAKPVGTQKEVYADKVHTSKAGKNKGDRVSSTPVQRDSQDMVRVEVNPADDNFAEDEAIDSPYNRETESDSDDGLSTVLNLILKHQSKIQL